MNELLDGMLVVQKLLRRERWTKLYVAAMALAASGALAGVAYRASDKPLAVLCAVLSLVLIVVSVRLIRDIAQAWNPRQDALLQILHQSPQLIVWVYRIHTHLAPFGIYAFQRVDLVLRLTNGSMLHLRGSIREIDCVEQMLRVQLPHATFGYSAEREQWYTANPMLLWNGDFEWDE